MASIRWVSVAPTTGLIIAELPGLLCQSTLTTLMGATGGTVNVEIPIKDRLPDNWEAATEPRRVLIAACYDDDQTTVLWAGMPIIRETGSGPSIRLTLTDAHGIMDRAYHGTPQIFQGWTDTDPVEIARILLLYGSSPGYYPGSGNDTPSDETIPFFRWEVNESAYAAAVRLAQETTVEWTIGWRWQPGPAMTEWGTRIRLWQYRTVAKRVGRQASPTVTPHLITGVDWRRTTDWSDGRGAAAMVGIGQSAGDSDPPVAIWPEGLVDPIPVIDTVSVDTDDYATVLAETQRRYEQTKDGTTTYDVDLILAESDLILGRDIGIGDDVSVDLANPDLPDLDHTLEARLVGWTAEPDPSTGQIVRVKPILVDREA